MKDLKENKIEIDEEDNLEETQKMEEENREEESQNGIQKEIREPFKGFTSEEIQKSLAKLDELEEKIEQLKGELRKEEKEVHNSRRSNCTKKLNNDSNYVY